MRELGGQERGSGGDLSLRSAQYSSNPLQAAHTFCILGSAYFNHRPHLKGS